MEKITKSEILKKIKELILIYDLENYIYLDYDILVINDEVKNKFNKVLNYLNDNFKTNQYYELIRDFGGEIIRNIIFNDEDILFYSHFISDSEEANKILDNLISNKINNYFIDYKEDTITKLNENILSQHIINEINNKIKPFDLNLITKIGKLYNDIIDIYLDLVDDYEKVNNFQTKNKINMINKMLLDVANLLSNWSEVTNCWVDKIAETDYTNDKVFIPKYEKDLKKVLYINNIKQALVMFVNKIDTIEFPKENIDSLIEYDSIDSFLNDNPNYGLPKVDSIFNQKIKRKKK